MTEVSEPAEKKQATEMTNVDIRLFQQLITVMIYRGGMTTTEDNMLRWSNESLQVMADPVASSWSFKLKLLLIYFSIVMKK